MLTITQIARRIGNKKRRVRYAIEKLAIPHVQRAGVTLLYDEKHIPTIEKELGIIRHRTYRED